MIFDLQAARSSLAKDIKRFRRDRDKARQLGNQTKANLKQAEANMVRLMAKAFEIPLPERQCGRVLCNVLELIPLKNSK